ncbi:MAG: hypothetical protein NVV70_10895 [Cellulomonas sp.]|uniref:Uncharacterized protein n=1 Tax=Cellulomonas gelida TaxID=1712 RepID=A0A4Y3KLR6_9CELL|nr:MULTISPECIES: hypothetical protein [Cellulomonas]MCR6648604.1 hypothetical protein [Cellulomonas sp.]MCR6704555.1 hypothetical protein [Cellulomonas sp.]GEA84324.1 hypothetical protein CGE01nite_15750 [Cellulomonas gelida]GGL32751.1 hypothetical protein GCM10009774_24150 [Cellulomonas gelida]
MLRRAVAAVAVPALSGLLLLASSASATAGGSDAPIPYDVSPEALTLPVGDTFDVHDHVNVRYTKHGRDGSANIHIEPGRSSAALVGKSTVRWELVGVPQGSCITWVQVSGYDEHFGEGGQKPVCNTTCKPKPNPYPTPSPSPSESPEPEPSPTPTVTPTPPPTQEPSPEPTRSPEPEPSQTPPPAPEPVESTPAPQPTTTPAVPPVPSDEETPAPSPEPTTPGDDEGEVAGPEPTPTPSIDSEVLVEGEDEPPLAVTGSDSLLPGFAFALTALVAGITLRMIHVRRRHLPAHRG